MRSETKQNQRVLKLCSLALLIAICRTDAQSPNTQTPMTQQQVGCGACSSSGQTVTFDTKTRRVLAGELPFSCPFCQLKGVKLAGQKLTKANLYGADLTGADLSGATLDGAILTAANLANANLDRAQLTSVANGPANLSRANLSGAKLRGAQMAGCNLQYAEVSGADFSGTDLTQTIAGPKAAKPGAVQAEAWQCGSADLSHLQNRIYVSAQGVDSSGCGASENSACQTIAQGIQRCSGAACGVLVAYGKYAQTQPLSLRNGVNVYGGCLPASQSNPRYVSIITGPAGGLAAVSADEITAATTLESFQLSASDAGGTNGASSIALVVSNSSGLMVLNSEIYAGRGGEGAAASGTGAVGDSGGTGATGTAAAGGAPGKVKEGGCTDTTGGGGWGESQVTTSESFACLWCVPAGFGPNGGNPRGSPGSTGYSTLPGQMGGPLCVVCSASYAGTGHIGEAGHDGDCGGSGRASSDIAGSFSGTRWSASIGGIGGAGGDGGGGGGGGAGGWWGEGCFWVMRSHPGGSGGGGGAGGCGGGGGNGGQQGGGSFAVVATASTLTLTNCRVVSALGGPGGAGGPAGAGGAGGAGGPGESSEASVGGWGGPGGTGGGGAGGAGGNGGPAIGVALLAGASLQGSGTVYYAGSSSLPGRGGQGAPSGSGKCTGATGGGGTLGLVADTHVY
ncbi:MAG TPA: pentapeptide repeat-containing protein [Bryobacteraceae bacterium]|jgi:uncharacterized protein YjbI with pentapeptide repeats|nr:pentapeptide repeat-containing protein [Bryobacteraceae bacterium]